MERAIEKALKFAYSLGIDEIEIYVKNEKIKKLNMKNNLENLEYSDFYGVGIRVIVRNKQGFFSLTNISEKSLIEGIKTAYKIARVSKKDPFWEGLPENYSKSKVEVFDKKLEKVEFDKILDIWMGIKNSLESGNISRGNIKSVVEKESLFSYSDSISEKRTSISATIGIRLNKYNFQKYHSFRSLELFEKNLNLEKMIEKASKLEKAEKISTGRYNVVFSPEVVSKIFKRMLVNMLSSVYAQKGSTPWIQGEKMFLEDFVMKDSGLVPFASGSRGFDGDGQKTKETVLVEDGVIKNYLYDFYRARIDGVETTGNAHRSFNTLPSPGSNNILIEEGEEKLEEQRKILYIDKVIGEKLSRPVSGLLNFSVSLGFFLDEKETPVTGVLIYEDFFDLVKNRMKVLKGREWYENYFIPPIFFENVLVIGK